MKISTVGFLVSLLLLITILAGCDSRNNPFGSDSYTSIEHQGQLYVLNSRTGEVFLIENGKKRPITSPSIESLLRENSANRIEFEIAFGDSQVLRAKGLAKLVGEEPRVRALIKPYISGINTEKQTLLWLRAVDEDGFQIAEIPVSRSDLTRTVIAGENRGWSLNTRLGLYEKAYRNVSYFEILWSDTVDDHVSAWLETEEGKAWNAEREQKAAREIDALLKEIGDGKGEDEATPENGQSGEK